MVLLSKLAAFSSAGSSSKGTPLSMQPNTCSSSGIVVHGDELIPITGSTTSRASGMKVGIISEFSAALGSQHVRELCADSGSAADSSCASLRASLHQLLRRFRLLRCGPHQSTPAHSAQVPPPALQSRATRLLRWEEAR
eukprot:3916300-Prymnesium_polylepis.2